MAKKTSRRLTPVEVIENRIFLIRGYRVMLDRDLAELYGVETRALNQAVKRNAARFPADFMISLSAQEAKAVLALRSQTVILKRGQNAKYLPYVFTEHGAVMLANILKSRTAIRASIQVVRAFVRLRRTIALSDDLAGKLHAIEEKLGHHDDELESIFRALESLLNPPGVEPAKCPIGFLPPGKR